jgi:hypothetical protein
MTYRLFLCVFVTFLFYYSPVAFGQTRSAKGPDAQKEKQAILHVLQQQTQYWNEGRLDQFMDGYWQSDSLQFIGGKGITYGWQNTLDRYQKTYPDQATRGTLRFDILQVELLGKDAMGQESAFVVGKFHLSRPEKGDASGHFTLLWKKIRGRWVITADHSSS